uniref:Putative minor capsid protein n=1 Tax=Mimivirus LCMiAC02 TaxID=2506609 RepID=A0A4D5XFK7_9VIRU|nr:MAG: putative minor capsid protein [Mimivirus LCMiAC02]
MSNQSSSRKLYTAPKYNHKFVGGRNPPIDKYNYINTQEELLKQSHQRLSYIPKINNVVISEDRHDPYKGFSIERGLVPDYINGDRGRFKTIHKYININSSQRNKHPILTTGESHILNKDPIHIKKGSNLIFIHHENHPFKIGDKFTLTGAKSKKSIRRTIVGGIPSFKIQPGCNFMKIIYTHGIPSDYIGTEIQVKFMGIKGDIGTKLTYLGNIPINILNSKYQIKLSLSPSDINPGCNLGALPGDYLDFSPDHFFVILPKLMHNQMPPYILKKYNYKIIELSTAGIPLNMLNANFPINQHQLKGCHTIKNISKDGYYIEIKNNGILTMFGGGSNITVSKVLKICEGFPKPNKYTIDLGMTIHHIVAARLFNIEFPFSSNIIKKFKNNTNNKIYWNNIDDGNHLYNIEVPPGNYGASDLSVVLEKLFMETERINDGGVIGSSYTKIHYMKVNINTNTNIVTFKLYKEYILAEPIIEIDPAIPLVGPIPNPPETEYILKIFHEAHGMVSPGKKILIKDSLSHFGIPIEFINTEHTVMEIVDEDNYKIKLARFNNTNMRVDNKGGVAVKIYIQDMFRLLFDKHDTMGKILGFRKPGNKNSITPFKHVITNADKYHFDIDFITKKGKNIKIKNNYIQLHGDNYVLMVANPLTSISNIGPIKNAFAKIILNGNPGDILFNTFVPTQKLYTTQFHKLSSLDIAFFTPDGKLYDFNGLEHSFMIELITVKSVPQGAGINADTGENYNVFRPITKRL